jgi:hypothetical protein
MSSLGPLAGAISDVSDLGAFYRPLMWRHKVNPATPQKINAGPCKKLPCKKVA